MRVSPVAKRGRDLIAAQSTFATALASKSANAAGVSVPKGVDRRGIAAGCAKRAAMGC